MFGNVLNFTPSPLAPFLGKWVRDDTSVGRKVAKRMLGEEAFRTFQTCKSIDELREYVDSDPTLADRYQRHLQLTGRSYLFVSVKAIVSESALPGNVTGANHAKTYPVLSLTKEGHNVVVQTVDGERSLGLVLRMKHSWLLVSERYFGKAAELFPRSRVHRYYRAPALET
jgi:hypothetical protein